MCISTVHYCCHRNVMHSVSYRLTQLNGIPCLICSGNLHLILKGIVNTVGRSGELTGEKEEERMMGKEAGSSSALIVTSSLPSPCFTSLPLWSVLSIGSQCESVIFIYAVTLYYTHVAISSHPVGLCHWWVEEKAISAFAGTEIVGIHYVAQKKHFTWDDINAERNI